MACSSAVRRAALALAFAAGPSVLGGCEEFEESRPADPHGEQPDACVD